MVGGRPGGGGTGLISVVGDPHLAHPTRGGNSTTFFAENNFNRVIVAAQQQQVEQQLL